MTLRKLLRILGHQEWIRFGLRDRVIRAFHSPASQKNEPFQVDFFGKVYPGNFSIYIDWYAFYYGAYSKQELYLMRDVLQEVNNPIILDVGANVGHHSLFASTIAQKVYALEPYPVVAEKIHANSINNIELHEIGLGEIDQELVFQPPTSNNMGTGSFTELNNNQLRQLELPICNGDSFLKSVGAESIDYIKMDIEGHEIYALKGLKNTLQAIRPTVFFEWSGNKRGIQMNTEGLFPDDYQLFDFVPGRVIGKFFYQPSYRLKASKVPFTDGNKLAIPVDRAAKLKKKIVE